MRDLIDYTGEILIAVCVIFFLWGFGYLINYDIQRQYEFGVKCLQEGKDYIEGNCVQ